MHEMSLEGIKNDMVWTGVQIDENGEVKMTLAKV
jgi:hypothetical protein